MSDASTDRSDLPTGVVTFLFADIEGSTQLLVELGDAYEPLLARHATIMRAALSAHHGVEVNTEGDAFFAAFASVSDSIDAAVAMQLGMGQEAWPVGSEIRVRMGLHTGEGLLGGDDYAGLDVNRAARIASSAHGGQIVISGATRALVGDRLDDVSLHPLGRHRLKDLPDAVELFQLEAPGLETSFPPVRTLEAKQTNLPPDATQLIGREQEIDAISGLLETRRLVTLTGPGGTGKTRLSRAVGASLIDRFADGVYFVAIEEAVDRAGVASAIAAALAVRERPDRGLEAGITSYLMERSLLLVVDNFEQAIDAAPLIGELLAASPGSRFLMTSRTALRVSGEQEVAVEPLALPSADAASAASVRANPAVALFIARATDIRPEFEPDDEELADIAAICRRLDGLPLAIELAAARMRMLRPNAILERLDHALPLLRGGARDRPLRQQTLAAAIDWSHELLNDEERRLFASLSVFAGGFTLEAAERVCGGGGEEVPEIDVFDGLASLSEQSLLRPPDETAEQPRFRMLHVIAEYAAARAAEDPDMASVAAAHAAWVADLVESVVPELLRREAGKRQRELRAEEENIRAALRWSIDAGETDVASRIGGSLWRFWHFWGRVAEGIDWLEQITAMPQEGVAIAASASVRSGLGSLHYWVGHLDLAEDHYAAAVASLETGGDGKALADARYDLAWPAFASGRADDATERFAAARSTYVTADDESGVALVDSSVAAMAYITTGDGPYEEALAAADDAAEVFDRHGRHHEWVGVQATSTYVHLQAGQVELAAESMKRTIGAMAELGDVGRLGEVLGSAARIELELGRPRRAVIIASATERHADQLGGLLTDSFFSSDVSVDARAALGEDAYSEAQAIGRGMTIAEAAEFVLSEDSGNG